jgi:hypothetical protein
MLLLFSNCSNPKVVKVIRRARAFALACSRGWVGVHVECVCVCVRVAFAVFARVCCVCACSRSARTAACKCDPKAVHVDDGRAHFLFIPCCLTVKFADVQPAAVLVLTFDSS